MSVHKFRRRIVRCNTTTGHMKRDGPTETLGYVSSPKAMKMVVQSVVQHKRNEFNTYENRVLYGTEDIHQAPLKPGDKVRSLF